MRCSLLRLSTQVSSVFNKVFYGDQFNVVVKRKETSVVRGTFPVARSGSFSTNTQYVTSAEGTCMHVCMHAGVYACMHAYLCVLWDSSDLNCARVT